MRLIILKAHGLLLLPEPQPRRGDHSSVSHHPLPPVPFTGRTLQLSPTRSLEGAVNGLKALVLRLGESEVPRGGLLGEVTQHGLGRTGSQAQGPGLAKGTMGLFPSPRRKTEGQ